MNRAMRVWAALLGVMAVAGVGRGEELRGKNAQFGVLFNEKGIASIRHTGDAFETDYVAEGSAVGGLVIRYRSGGGEWKVVRTGELAGVWKQVEGREGAAACEVVYRAGDLEITETSGLEEEGKAAANGGKPGLVWTIGLKNVGRAALEVGDLGIMTPFNTQFGGSNANGGGSFAAHQRTLTQRAMTHFWVAGSGSFMYFMRPNAVGPALVMVPTGETKLEYFDVEGGRGAVEVGGVATMPASGPRPGGRVMFIHSAASAERLAVQTKQWEGQMGMAGAPAWRHPHTGVTLAAAGQAGDGATYGFKMRFGADGGVAAGAVGTSDYDHVRQVLYEEEGLDVQVVPGMTVPSDLPVTVALLTRSKVDAVVGEFADKTGVEEVPAPASAPVDTRLFRVKFSKLGENLLTVKSGAKETRLEFFVTEPLETVVKKRAAFLVSHHQWRDASKWYDGVFSEWDAVHKVLRSPEDIDGLRMYILTCDDPGLGKAPYLASKNVVYPDQGEVAALDYYLTRFVWGKLQMTEEERWPYAIYGIDHWFKNRNSTDAGRNGRDHVWRIYDYPHIVLLYYRMYQIAKQNPQLKMELTAEEYLKRAAGTALAYFTVPVKVEGWSAYDTGTYNEVIIPEVIDALRAEGKVAEAEGLRGHWEQKVKTFVFARDPYLYGSEYAFDSTTFEGSGALAKWAVERMIRPGYAEPPSLPAIGPRGASPRVPRRLPAMTEEAARGFMERQVAANIVDRGWLEGCYYYMGSDYRGGMGGGYLLSYMSQMGGWAVMDYALNQAKDPYEVLRLGYASTLSSWALVNSGNAESGYGYWFPGKENDGAAGGGFEPRSFSRAWIGKTTPRGSWYYACEIDLGFSGALRTMATVVADDPVFGMTAYGGDLKVVAAGGWEVVPKDGLRQRLHVVKGGKVVQLVLGQDGFAAGEAIGMDEAGKRLRFVLENRSGRAHGMVMTCIGARMRVAGGAEKGVPVGMGVEVKVGEGARQEVEVELE